MGSTDTQPPMAAARGHVLVISPRTFSYHLSICETLRNLGYRVTWWDERARSSTWYKLALRLLPGWTVRWSETSFRGLLHALDRASVSHLLVIKGEALSSRFATELRAAVGQASAGLYLWDGVDNAPRAPELAQVFDSAATFDPVDARTLGWAFRPLFAGTTNTAAAAVADKPDFDWCFIGTIHSDRHRVIHRLRRASGPQSRHFVFGYLQSPLVSAVRRLLDWTMWFAPRGTLSTSPMRAADVADIVRRSKAVLDVEHPRQRGLTMRTIETLLAGKKLVTTNQQILGSDLYHPSRVHIISRDAPAIPPAFIAQPFEPIPESLRRKYSCEGWASELLALQDAAHAAGSKP